MHFIKRDSADSFCSVVASAIFYGVIFWSSSMAAADRKRLNKLLKKASSVLVSSGYCGGGGGGREDDGKSPVPDEPHLPPHAKHSSSSFSH